MKYDLKRNSFDKVLMAGIFVGIVVTVVSLFVDATFLESTGFPYDIIINVSSLIFGVNLVFLVIGVIYYAFTRLPKYGTVFFITVFVLLTLFLLLKVKGIERTDNALLNSEFRELLSMIIILVASGAIVLPFLINNRKFREHVI